MASTGRRLSHTSDDQPVPKSSMAMRTPDAARSLEHLRRALRVAHQRRLGELELQARGGRSKRVEQLGDRRRRGRGRAASRADRLTATCRSSPSARHAATWRRAARARPSSAARMRSLRSASGQEVAGRRAGRARGAASARAPRRPRPAPSVGVDLRLVVQDELAARRCRRAARAASASRSGVFGSLGRVVEADARAVLLGVVHRDVGAAQDRVGVLACRRDIATPTLAPSARRRSPTSNGSSQHARAGGAASSARRVLAGSRRAGRRTRRRSGARRRRRARTARAQALGDRCAGRSSPFAWPSVSLMSLKRSRSSSSTAQRRSPRAA